ncbi:MAG: CBS domain-containing protein [Bdellovibrionota bacterium]
MAGSRSRIHPSPAIVTRADTPIRECVRLMQKNRVGSILIISDTASQQLIGIFTERDLLQKIDLIDQGKFWSKPVRTVMSQPIRVLELSKLDQAAEVMVKFGFRHLPVVVSDAKVKYRLVGVISMRDLFVNLVRNTKWAAERRLPLTLRKRRSGIAPIGVITADPYLLRLLKESISFVHRIHIEHLSFTDITQGLAKPKVLVIDLDHFKPGDWLEMLKRLNKTFRPPFTVVVFDPSRYESGTVGILYKLKAAQGFTVFEKPLPIAALANQVTAALLK